jgi:hypothetical protein
MNIVSSLSFFLPSQWCSSKQVFIKTYCVTVTAIRYVATKEEPITVAVEGEDLQDVKHDVCSGAFTFVQEALITMLLTVCCLKLLI